jgi:glyoxylase-like metal-dependent hydrolase (beta-lactamase superfamily II)
VSQKKYRIKPLPLSVMAIDKSILTYRMGYGTKIDVANCMFYIEGADKNIIVDTATDAIQAKEIRGFAARNIMSFEQALASVGLKPENVDIVIQTHLHWDHCVNTNKCKNAKVIVSEDELRFCLAPHPVFAPGYRKELIRGSRLFIVNGRYEVAPGIELIPVPGHSPGAQAVAIDTEKGKAVITGFCGIRENLEPSENAPGNTPVLVSGMDHNACQAFDSALRIKGLADILITLHDISLVDGKSFP